MLSHILSRRLGAKSLRNSSWPRICILIVFVDSYLFLLVAGVLTLGVGLGDHPGTCYSTTYICLAFYGSSKVFVYWFLVERVYLVWRPFPSATRSQCKVYVACLIVCLFVYTAVLIVCFHFASTTFADGICKIVLEKPSAISLLTFDFSINILLTGLFVWPLFRFRFSDVKIKRLGKRSLWAALVALTTSSINMLMATMMDGVQLSWICFGSCAVDVVVNAIALFWVTDTIPDPDEETGITAPHFLHFNTSTQQDTELSPVSSGPLVDVKTENRDLESVKTHSRHPSRSLPPDNEHVASNFQLQIHITKELSVRESISVEPPR